MTILAAVLAASPGTEVQSGSLPLAAPIALVAGLLSFLSPCVLPLVPGYLSYVTGMSAVELRAGDSRVDQASAGSAVATSYCSSSDSHSADGGLTYLPGAVALLLRDGVRKLV